VWATDFVAFRHVTVEQRPVKNEDHTKSDVKFLFECRGGTRNKKGEAKGGSRWFEDLKTEWSGGQTLILNKGGLYELPCL